MELISNTASVALIGVAGKLAYSSVLYWWNKKTLKSRYIKFASGVQNLHEEESLVDDPLVVEELLSRKAIGEVVRRHKGSFRVYLVQKGKSKFGCPVRNEANRLVVRKYLYDACVEHGLVARHINDHIDVATELVFIPSREQLTALAISHTKLSKIRIGVSNDLGGPRANIA